MFLKTVMTIHYKVQDSTSFDEVLKLIGPGSKLRAAIDTGKLYGTTARPIYDPETTFDTFIEVYRTIDLDSIAFKVVDVNAFQSDDAERSIYYEITVQANTNCAQIMAHVEAGTLPTFTARGFGMKVVSPTTGEVTGVTTEIVTWDLKADV